MGKGGYFPQPGVILGLTHNSILDSRLFRKYNLSQTSKFLSCRTGNALRGQDRLTRTYGRTGSGGRSGSGGSSGSSGSEGAVVPPGVVAPVLSGSVGAVGLVGCLLGS